MMPMNKIKSLITWHSIVQGLQPCIDTHIHTERCLYVYTQIYVLYVYMYVLYTYVSYVYVF